MNSEYTKRLLGKLNQTKVVRLADMSGDTFWHKNKRFNAKETGPLPYQYETIDLKQRAIFATAKQLQIQGILKIVFKSGENWFVRVFENPEVTLSSPIFGEVN